MRDSVAMWIELADQLPPPTVDRVLPSCAASSAGPGFRQARENLKKIRGLIRRIPESWLPHARPALGLLRGLVAGGDESNAIIDAADAVNLMTVHAAKGLEFPVVFVVNIGSGNTRDDVRVSLPPFTGDDEEEASRS